jgi:hypothetical protein
MRHMSWKQFFGTIALLSMLLIAGYVLAPFVYRKTIEVDIARHRVKYASWLTVDNVADISDKGAKRYRVLGQAAVPECRTGCEVDSLCLSCQEDYCRAVWKKGQVVMRVLVAYRTNSGRVRAANDLHQANRLLGQRMGCETDSVSLFDVSSWLLTGRLRIGQRVNASETPSWFVVQSTMVGIDAPPAPFWCYWEADSDGRILQKGLYGS